MNIPDREKLAGLTKEKLRKHLTLKNVKDNGEYDLINNFTQKHIVSKGKLVGCPITKIFGEPYSINRLAYILFYGDIDSGSVVSFLNGDKKDYRVKNLIAGTMQEIREIKMELRERGSVLNKKSTQSNFDEIFEASEEEEASTGKLVIKITKKQKQKNTIRCGNYVMDTSDGEIYLVCKNGGLVESDVTRRFVNISDGEIYDHSDIFEENDSNMKKIDDPTFTFTEIL